MTHNIDARQVIGLLTANANFYKDKNLTKVELYNESYIKTQLTEKTVACIKAVRIIATDLIDICTDSEWKMVKTIAKDLNKNNMLWSRKAINTGNNNSIRLTIKSLVDKDILIPTKLNTTYIVNPLYIRHGEYFDCIYCTLSLIENGVKETSHTVVNPINKYKK